MTHFGDAVSCFHRPQVCFFRPNDVRATANGYGLRGPGELAATTAAIRRAIEDDRFPHAPRLDPLRAALGKFEAAEPAPLSKAPPPAKADKRTRR